MTQELIHPPACSAFNPYRDCASEAAARVDVCALDDKKNRERIATNQKKRYYKNRKKILAQQKRWREANPERCKANGRRWHEGLTPEQKMEKHLRARFDMSLDNYDEMLAVQDGRCALCGEALGDPPKSRRRHPIDHDHNGTNGKTKCAREDVRGILHTSCNVFLGFIEKRPGILEKVKMYLDRDR